ncbi:TIGR03084 family metal-binding protein [Modestobacter sp. VKM Ac-2986]|uniref:TIGR03084 family metal-binding protein n=1 Tax=Modestobacter sp. VKM Ac-2986 TaxID=3004140 RepID=UPI0022AA287D|nr:TIGR03084 family metal-binding protein [Modestobacter sp. VKM Ac-2986]MCZ2828845.1 TIGR03084 family metal-binding protein [Modestobacter sp. VKM Ac-2986]
MRGALLADLAAEGAVLEDLLTALAPADWTRDTSAAGWTVGHQVAHLAWTDDVALLAATDPGAFADRVAGDPPDAVEAGARAGAAAPPAVLLARWRAGRERLADALAAVPDGTRLPWFGPPMSVASLVTARLMETWAHGVDVRDALGHPVGESRRLDHVAHLGVRTRDFAFTAHGLPVPAAPVRVELTRADGSRWTAGPEDADQRVTGPLLDFCLRVVQRRPRAVLDLHAVGPDAGRWLDVAQAFAGAPGAGSQGPPPRGDGGPTGPGPRRDEDRDPPAGQNG